MYYTHSHYFSFRRFQAVLRGLTLKTLTEMLKYRGEMFKNYAELLTLKVVNAYKDTAKEVVCVFTIHILFHHSYVHCN